MNTQNPSLTQNPSEINFETAFARLEEILERMNSGAISLDESLKLYEEADALINLCSKKLCDAERKVEILMKNRANELALTPDQRPITQEFLPSSNGQSMKQPSKDIF